MRELGWVLASALVLGGCAFPEPRVPGGWTTYNDMKVYYRRHAWEWDGRCRMPYLDGVLESEVVEETPERLELDVTYYWRDQVGDSNDDEFFAFGGSDRCRGIEHRTFTLEKLEDGGLETVAMTGLRRGGDVPSLF